MCNRRQGVRWHNVVGVGLLCVVGVALGGCGISQGRYDVAVAEMESARTDAETTWTARESLALDNARLRTDHEQATRDVEALLSEIQDIKDGRDRERGLLAAREAQLKQAGRAQAGTLQAMRRSHQKLQGRNRVLRESVRRYRNALKDVRTTRKASEARPSHPAAQSAVTDSRNARPPAASPTSRMASSPSTDARRGATSAPVNLNAASVRDLMVLGLTESMARAVVANRPYRLRGELLARHVLSSKTFAMIQNRITAKQP